MTDQLVFARALPESIRITETYFYDQEVSRNPTTRAGQSPTGQIEISVPYDGYQYFTRAAVFDVWQQLGTDNYPGKADALIGHLAFDKYGRTDLREILDLGEHYGSVPLRVPVAGTEIASVPQLCDDQHACVTTYKYAPRRPDVMPISVEMELLDEDALNLLETELRESEQSKALSNIVEQIAQQVNFRRNLLLVIRVRLVLPNGSILDKKPSQAARNGQPAQSNSSNWNPKVARVSLHWPTITSFRALQLLTGTIVPERESPILYDPLDRNLEWSNVQMQPVESSSPDLRTFYSQRMFLLIDQPGELYQQSSLDGQVDVEVSGSLISGLQARLYNGLGILSSLPESRFKQVTHVVANLHLILDDAFARRTLSPYQHLYFDGVIPDEMRVADIKTALADRGFRISKELDKELPHKADELRHFVLALRPEGPDLMKLWVLVEGKRYATTRQSQVPGGQTYTSTFESGELKVYMRGELPGNSQVLTHEMNALQAALRDRFERLRAKR